MLDKTKILSTLLLACVVLIAFLGYSCYTFKTEILRLMTDLQSVNEAKQILENQYQTLFDQFVLLNQSYFTLDADYTSLNETCETLAQNYTELSNEYYVLLTNYVDLTIAYHALNETYYSLLQNYTALEQAASSNYTMLLSQYQTLMQNYQQLLQNYTQLKSEYDEMHFAFYEPLLADNKVAPTVEELTQWLAADKTDKITYAYPDFVCGDFAVMLHMHAKMKHWDMGVVGVLGNLGDGSEFNHAFNAIICAGNTLKYVEPQTDAVFEATIGDGLWYFHPGFGMVHVREFIVMILFDNG